MPKIKFDNGVVMTLDREPSSQEIEELGKIAMSKGRPPSIASQGLSYAKEHPFKTIFQPISQTLTGKSIGERTDLLNKAGTSLVDQSGIDVQKNLQEQLAKGRTLSVPRTPGMGEFFMRQLPAAIAQAVITLADVSPFDVATLGLLPKVGKIPVGSTTVRRIAKKVDVGPGFVKGVGELQRMESALQQSGKLSSRGIYQQDYKPGIENPVFRAFVAAVQPNLRKFKSGKDLQNYKKDVSTAIQTINDYSPALQLKNPETEQITNLPTQSRNIVDFLLNKNAPNNKALLVDALEQTKRKLWQSTSGMSREASSQGVKIDMGKEVTNLLDETIKSPQMNTYRSDLVKEAIRLKEKYALRGEVSPMEVEDDLKYLNQEIGKVWNSKDKNAVDFYLKISQSLRKKMDDSIEEFLGKGGWQEGRNKYRALKNIESDVLRSAAKTALKGDSTLGDKLLDTFAGEELVRSILTLNPKILANAAAIESFRILRGHFFNPDIRIKNLFKIVGKSTTGPTKNIRPLNPNQPSRGFPFPEGPASIRQPIQGPPRLPYTPQGQLPYLGRALYKPTGYPGGAPPQKPLITPYEPGGPAIRGQAPYQGTTLPAISPQPTTPKQPLNLDQLRKSLQRKTQGQPLRGRHEVSPEQVIELPPRQSLQGKPLTAAEAVSQVMGGKGIILAHNTSVDAKSKILAEGFNTKKFGSTSKKYGYKSEQDPVGISFTETKEPIDQSMNTWQGKGTSDTVYSVPEFKNALNIPDEVNGKSWKEVLHEKYGTNGDGKSLTKALLKDGYDGIITNYTRAKGTAEIIALDPSSVKNFKTFEEASAYSKTLLSEYEAAKVAQGQKGKPLTAAEAVKQGIGAQEWVASQGDVFYRGEGQGKGGNYFTKSEEFANEFAGIKPLTKVNISEKDIYRPGQLPEAVNENQVTKSIQEAKDKGFKAVYVSEGEPFGEPIESVFVIDKSAIKTKSQLLSEYEAAKEARGPNPLRNKSGQAFKGLLGPTMAIGVGLATALKATTARGETGEFLDPKYKQQIANAENYGKVEGDWAQIEDIVIRDLKRIGKLKQNITLEQVKKDPQLYDKVVKLYWDRLDAFGIPEKDKALWWLMPGRYRQTGGDISRLKNPEHRNIMRNRVKNIGGRK